VASIFQRLYCVHTRGLAFISKQNPAEKFLRGVTWKLAGELCAIVADGFDRAAFLGFLAACLFFGCRGLFIYQRVAAVVVALEIVRRGLAAQVAVNALVVHVVFARDVLGIFICSVSHKFVVEYGFNRA